MHDTYITSTCSYRSGGIFSIGAGFSFHCYTFSMLRVTPPVSRGTMMPSLHPVNCLTCSCRRMPGRGLAPMPPDQGQESPEAPSDLDLDLDRMEPPHLTLVRRINTLNMSSHLLVLKKIFPVIFFNHDKNINILPNECLLSCPDYYLFLQRNLRICTLFRLDII